MWGTFGPGWEAPMSPLGDRPVDSDVSLEDEVPPGIGWLGEAVQLLDGVEAINERSELRMIRAAAWLDRRVPVDVPWCGLFVGHCLRTALPNAPQPLLRMRARPWRNFGRAAEPQVGAILIFWQVMKRSPFGHCGFYWAEDDECYHVLGGNQRTRIEIQRWPKERLIGCRWPSRAIVPPGLRRWRDPSEATPFEGVRGPAPSPAAAVARALGAEAAGRD